MILIDRDIMKLQTASFILLQLLLILKELFNITGNEYCSYYQIMERKNFS